MSLISYWELQKNPCILNLRQFSVHCLKYIWKGSVWVQINTYTIDILQRSLMNLFFPGARIKKYFKIRKEWKEKQFISYHLDYLNFAQITKTSWKNRPGFGSSIQLLLLVMSWTICWKWTLSTFLTCVWHDVNKYRTNLSYKAWFTIGRGKDPSLNKS